MTSKHSHFDVTGHFKKSPIRRNKNHLWLHSFFHDFLKKGNSLTHENVKTIFFENMSFKFKSQQLERETQNSAENTAGAF